MFRHLKSHIPFCHPSHPSIFASGQSTECSHSLYFILYKTGSLRPVCVLYKLILCVNYVWRIFLNNDILWFSFWINIVFKTTYTLCSFSLIEWNVPKWLREYCKIALLDFELSGLIWKMKFQQCKCRVQYHHTMQNPFRVNVDLHLATYYSVTWLKLSLVLFLPKLNFTRISLMILFIWNG